MYTVVVNVYGSYLHPRSIISYSCNTCTYTYIHVYGLTHTVRYCIVCMIVFCRMYDVFKEALRSIVKVSLTHEVTYIHVYACMRACVRACVHMCGHAWVCVRACVYVCVCDLACCRVFKWEACRMDPSLRAIFNSVGRTTCTLLNKRILEKHFIHVFLLCHSTLCKEPKCQWPYHLTRWSRRQECSLEILCCQDIETLPLLSRAPYLNSPRWTGQSRALKEVDGRSAKILVLFDLMQTKTAKCIRDSFAAITSQ